MAMYKLRSLLLVMLLQRVIAIDHHGILSLPLSLSLSMQPSLLLFAFELNEHDSSAQHHGHHSEHHITTVTRNIAHK